MRWQTGSVKRSRGELTGGGEQADACESGGLSPSSRFLLREYEDRDTGRVVGLEHEETSHVVCKGFAKALCRSKQLQHQTPRAEILLWLAPQRAREGHTRYRERPATPLPATEIACCTT